jgi:hypothetical protein
VKRRTPEHRTGCKYFRGSKVFGQALKIIVEQRNRRIGSQGSNENVRLMNAANSLQIFMWY